MTTDRCQYGEESIVLDFFQSKVCGFVVEVGAADGVTFSQSHFLIRDHGWSGILIEPEPTQAKALRDLYSSWPEIRVIESAAGEQEGVAMLHPSALASTFNEQWRQKAVSRESVFGDPVQVRVAPLRTLLYEANCPPVIDYLSIDCEGMDLDVLKSMDWQAYTVMLICVESGSDGSGDNPLNVYLREIGYEYHAHTTGNTFWRINAC